MWPEKSKRATNETKRPIKPEAHATAVVLLLWAAACGNPAASPHPADSLRIRAAHLTDYAWTDRSGNGQPDNLKPADQRAALLCSLADEPADVLILRGLGSEPALRHLQEALSDQGHPFPHAVYVPGPTVYAGIGFLSRRQPLEVRTLSDRTFRVGDRRYRPLAGGIRIKDGNGEPLWIWNAQPPEPSARYERRRNESRLLARALREPLSQGQRVLLSLHSREDPDSPMLRMIHDLDLQHLMPVDDRGDPWTHRDPNGIHYHLDQWLFLSPNLADPPPAARVLDSPDLRTAGDFRHQLLEFPVAK